MIVQKNDVEFSSPPSVSIVIACFNSESFLRETLDSVCSQTFNDFEVVIVDDCSTDSTPKILAEYSAVDPRLIIIRHENNKGRPAFSKNSALQRVRGKYVCFLDHDDLYHPKKLELLVGLLEKYPQCVAAFHDIDLVDSNKIYLSRYLEGFVTKATDYLIPQGDGEYICTDDFFKFQTLNYAALHTISVLICPERLPQNELQFDTQYFVCDDTDLWVRLGIAGRIVYIDSVLGYYRQHESNITRDQTKVKRDAIKFMLNNYKRLQGHLTKVELKRFHMRIAYAHSDYAWELRGLKRYVEASLAYIESLRWNFCLSNVINIFKVIIPRQIL